MVCDFYLLGIDISILIINYILVILAVRTDKVENNKGQLLCGTFFGGTMILIVLEQSSC